MTGLGRFKTVVNGSSRPIAVGHDRPLYGKQFCDMEFICVPKAAGEIKL
jgi:hypothetical protein